MDDGIEGSLGGYRDPSEASVSPTPAGETAPWPLEERPGFLARRLHQIHVSLFSERCGEFRVTPLQYSILSLLVYRGEADQTTLSNAIALDRTTTTGAVKRLEARGLVSRTISASDRRAQTCRPTQAGLDLHAAMEDAARQAHAATIAVLSPAERASFVHLMKKLTAAHAQRRGSTELKD